MASMMVSGQWKLGLRVAAAGSDRERNTKAQQGIIERCSDVIPEGTDSLTVEEVQFYVSRQIQHEMEVLRLNESDHETVGAGVFGSRLVRDDSYSEVFDKLSKARRAFVALYPDRTVVRLLGRDKEVPTDPVRLYMKADNVRKRLALPEFDSQSDVLDAFGFDPAAFVEQLADPVERLRTAIHALPEGERDSVDTLKAKTTALDELRRLIGMSARFYEALYDLAGMEFESDRIRQSSHRPRGGGPEDVPPGEPLPEEDVPTADGPAEPTATQEAGPGDTSNVVGFPPAAEGPAAAPGRGGAEPSAG